MERSSTNSCTCQVTCWVSKEHEKLLLLSLNWIRTLRPWNYPAATHELQPYHQLPGPSSTSRSFCANLQVLDSRRNIRLFGRAFDVRSYTSPTDPEFNRDVLIYFISRTYFLEGPRSKNWWTEELSSGTILLLFISPSWPRRDLPLGVLLSGDWTMSRQRIHDRPAEVFDCDGH